MAAGEEGFDSILPLCHVSSSQEMQFRIGHFAPESYIYGSGDESSDSGASGVRMASTPIRLVSLSDSDEHDFHTPPEEAPMSSSSEIRPIGEVRAREEGVDDQQIKEHHGGGDEAVDLSRDSELGFPVVEEAQKGMPDSDAKQVILEESAEEIRSGTTRQGESPLKNSEVEGVQLEKSDSCDNQMTAEVFDVGTGRVEESPLTNSEVEAAQQEKYDNCDNRMTAEVFDVGTGKVEESPLTNSEVEAAQQEKYDNCDNRMTAEVFDVGTGKVEESPLTNSKVEAVQQEKSDNCDNRMTAEVFDVGTGKVEESPLTNSKVEAVQQEKSDSCDNRIIAEVFDVGTGKLEESPFKRLKISEESADDETKVSETVAVSSRSPVARKLNLGNGENSEEAELFPSEPDRGISRLSNAEETQETEDAERRRLPSSTLGQAENVATSEKEDEGSKEQSVWDILKLLAEQCEPEPPVTGSFIEIAKRLGLL